MMIRKAKVFDFNDFFKLKTDFCKFHMQFKDSAIMIDIKIPNRPQEIKLFNERVKKRNARLFVAAEVMPVTTCYGTSVITANLLGLRPGLLQERWTGKIRFELLHYYYYCHGGWLEWLCMMVDYCIW